MVRERSSDAIGERALRALRDLRREGRHIAVARRLTGPDFREGDIIVMAVAKHYAIGRMTTDGVTQEHLASEKDLAAALARACTLAGALHRVFLYKMAGSGTFERVNCHAVVP